MQAFQPLNMRLEFFELVFVESLYVQPIFLPALEQLV